MYLALTTPEKDSSEKPVRNNCKVKNQILYFFLFIVQFYRSSLKLTGSFVPCCVSRKSAGTQCVRSKYEGERYAGTESLWMKYLATQGHFVQTQFRGKMYAGTEGNCFDKE
jgi:hypothetical protein